MYSSSRGGRAGPPPHRRWLPAAITVVFVAAGVAVAVIWFLGRDTSATSTTLTATSATAPPSTEPDSTTTTVGTTPATTGAQPTTTESGLGILYDVGVTEEPCPDSSNPQNGCIYLGVISDLSDGLFAALAMPLTLAEQDFWTIVNEEGGIGGFDVAITPETTVDAHYDPQQHVEGLARIEPAIAVLAQTLGTPQTLAALRGYDEANLVGVPATWWSGWSFPDHDAGLILEAGASYCIEAMNAFDFVAVSEGGAQFTYAVVAFPGDDGGDYTAGVRLAAAAHGIGDPLEVIIQIPVSSGGDVSAAVATLVAEEPDVVFLAIGPEETAEILAEVGESGYQPAMYVGFGPSWDVALLQHEALLPVLEEAFYQSSPWAGWSAETEGHAAMRAAADRFGREPSTGYTAGWVFQYNVLALLEAGIAEGDLTRAGLRRVAAELEVDYREMLPPRSFGGVPDETIMRQSLLNRVDPSEPDGLSQTTNFFRGATVSGYVFEAPCAAS